jgi:hypothetical protein
MEKKDNVIGTRVSDKLMNDILEYTNEKNIGVSKLIREALSYYMLFKLEHEKQNVPIIIISKAEYSTILGLLDERGLEKLADVCVQLARKGFDYSSNSVKSFLRSLDTYVFSEKNQNWFKEFRTNFQGNRLLVAGVHDLNKNFSLFMKFYIEKLVALYSYKLIKHTLLEHKLIVEFQKKG